MVMCDHMMPVAHKYMRQQQMEYKGKENLGTCIKA